MAIHSETRPPRRSFSQQVSALGARLTRSLPAESEGGSVETAPLVDKGDSPSDPDRRSTSRGRGAFSSGRGGIGNIRRPSESRDARLAEVPDDASHFRGREPAVHPDRVFSVGRGGAGNIRSPSRDAHPLSGHAVEAEYEAKLVREHAEATTIHSSGRGGAGNITGSRSRSRGPGAVMHSTGRGGAGNILPGSTPHSEALEEEERRRHAHHEHIHSTGRGGAANITAVHEPGIEHVTHHLGEFESSGRGGAGNIRTRSSSRDPGAASKEKHGIAAVFDKFSHPHGHGHGTNQPRASADERPADASY